jgi:glycosyltransferase involved in cell wall biosynthesis
MQAVDWVVVPSVWWENAPLVIEEARAAGRPVIVSGIGGLAEAVRHDIDGLHVPPGDAASLAETLAMASGDAALWDRLSRAGRPRAYASFMDAHLRCYRGLREGAVT